MPNGGAGEQEEPRRAGDAEARLAIFPASDRRSARWQRVSAMIPVDPTERELEAPAPPSASTGYSWELLLAHDSTLSARTRLFRSRVAARRDAAALLGAPDGLRLLYVRDAEGHQFSWWIAAGDEVVLVPLQSWPSTKRTTVVHNATRALALLHTALPRQEV